MNQKDVLKLVVKDLNDLKIAYMLTGAFAVSFYGKPRTTHDIDFKIEVTLKDIQKVYDKFQSKFYVSKEGIQDAIEHKTMFNIIHNDTSIKVDFWLFQNNEFDQERLDRRKKTTLFALPTYISSPEDLIIIKLKWFKESESQKHFEDALGIWQISKDLLDLKYIRKWIRKFGVENIWEKILKGRSCGE